MNINRVIPSLALGAGLVVSSFSAGAAERTQKTIRDMLNLLGDTAKAQAASQHSPKTDFGASDIGWVETRLGRAPTPDEMASLAQKWEDIVQKYPLLASDDENDGTILEYNKRVEDMREKELLAAIATLK